MALNRNRCMVMHENYQLRVNIHLKYFDFHTNPRGWAAAKAVMRSSFTWHSGDRYTWITHPNWLRSLRNRRETGLLWMRIINKIRKKNPEQAMTQRNNRQCWLTCRKSRRVHPLGFTKFVTKHAWVQSWNDKNQMRRKYKSRALWYKKGQTVKSALTLTITMR